MAPSFTLRTVTTSGSLDQFLPDFQTLDMSPVFCQAGTVAFKYPESGVNFNLLAEDLEIAVIVEGVEVDSLRCIIEAVEGQDATENETGTIWGYTCRTVQGLLDRAVVYPKNWPVSQPPSHPFVAASPGKILIDLLTKAQSRGALLSLTWDFTDTVDSNGMPWSTWNGPLDMSFDAGTTYSDVVQSLVEGNFIEVRTSKRMLQAYGPDTLGSDRSTGTAPLRFTKGRDIRESPRKISSREIATAVLLSGSENIYAEREATGAEIAKWGRRETYYSANNVNNMSLLDYIGYQLMLTKGRPLLEVTHGLLFEVEENARPLRDFDIGDWGLSDVGKGWEKYRIKQWVMAVDSAGLVTGSVTLNDLLADRDEKINKRLTKLTNGSTSAGAPEDKDKGQIPGVPGNVQLNTDYYLDHDTSRAIVTMTWSPLTENSDGSELLDLTGYRARWRYAGDAFWRATISLDSDETAAFFPNLLTNSVVEAQVQAVNKYNRSGGWSGLVQITTARDLVAPVKPASPMVTSRVGILRVTWSGLDYLGQQQVADFAGVEVHVGPNGTFTPDENTLKDYLTARSMTSTALTEDLNYGTEYWIRLVAVDTEGNRSEASDETGDSHAVLTQVVNLEIGTGQVSLSNTRFSDIGNLVEDGSFENDQLRNERALAISGTHMYFDNITPASSGHWSLGVVGESPSWFPEILTLQSGLPVKPGERIFGAADYRFSADVDPSSMFALALVWYDKDGNILDPQGTPALDDDYVVLSSTYQAVPYDLTWVSRVTRQSKIAPAGATSYDIQLRVVHHYAGTMWIDNIEVRRQIDTLMIGDAVVQAAHIGLLQVNDAHIVSASVGKLTTGTLTADIVLASRIKTADTGARVEVNSGGIGAWNSAGIQTVAIAGADGSVNIIGQLRSGPSGRRIEINPTSTNLPEIRFYPTSGNNYGFLNAASGGSDVSIGLNTGTYIDSASSVTVHNRLWMGSGFTELEVVRSDDQTVFGGSVNVTSERASIGLLKGSLSENRIDFLDDGQMRFIGEVGYYNSNQNAIMAGITTWSDGPFIAVSVAYGATSSSTPRPLAIINDEITSGDGNACSVQNCNSTGFVIRFVSLSNGASGGTHWWAFRL